MSNYKVKNKIKLHKGYYRKMTEGFKISEFYLLIFTSLHTLTTHTLYRYKAVSLTHLVASILDLPLL